MTLTLSREAVKKYRDLQKHVSRGTGLDRPSLSVVITYCHAKLLNNGS
mgnify:FL=1